MPFQKCLLFYHEVGQKYRKQALVVSFWILLGLGITFLIYAFNAAGACYVMPCVVGDLQSLYKVSTGLSFQLVLSGMMFVAQPIFGFWVLRAPCTELVAGGIIIGSMFITILSLVCAVLWGGEANTMLEIVAYEQAGHNITANQALQSTFSVLSGIASFIFIIGTCNVGLLVVGREFYSEFYPHSTANQYFGNYYQQQTPPIPGNRGMNSRRSTKQVPEVWEDDVADSYQNQFPVVTNQLDDGEIGSSESDDEDHWGLTSPL